MRLPHQEGKRFVKFYIPSRFVLHLGTVQECFSKCVLEVVVSDRKTFLR